MVHISILGSPFKSIVIQRRINCKQVTRVNRMLNCSCFMVAFMAGYNNAGLASSMQLNHRMQIVTNISAQNVYDPIKIQQSFLDRKLNITRHLCDKYIQIQYICLCRSRALLASFQGCCTGLYFEFKIHYEGLITRCARSVISQPEVHLLTDINGYFS